MEATSIVKGVFGIGEKPYSNALAKRTFAKALPAGALEGMANGLLSLNAYVALTSLNASALGISTEISTLVTMLPSIAMMFATLYNRGGPVCRRRGYFLFAAFAGRFLFAFAPLCVFLPGVWAPIAFVSLIGVSALAYAGVPPALNQIWGANYVTSLRGGLFARMSSVGMLMVMLASLFAGWFMDQARILSFVDNWQLVYVAAGCLGAMALLAFWRIRMRYSQAVQTVDSNGVSRWRRFWASWGRSIDLLKRDKNFRVYEIGFFLYGMAFMILLPVVPVFFEQYLNASYEEFSMSTVVTAQATLMVVTPIVAWLARGKRVAKVTGVAFSMLLVYPALLAVSFWTRDVTFAVIAFIAFGIGMSGVHFSWNLGPVTFARGGNALAHTSAHTSLVGVRALVGFPLSYGLMKAFPNNLLPVFGVSVAFLIAGALVMFWLDARMKAAGVVQTT